eukprot:EG_transcript_42871
MSSWLQLAKLQRLFLWGTDAKVHRGAVKSGTPGSGTQSGPPGNVVRRANPGDWPPECTVNGGAEVYYTSEEDSKPAQKEGGPCWETVNARDTLVELQTS